MQVETFECEETRSERVECTGEALALIEQLGLTGQQSLNSNAGGETRCPYRKMTKEEMTVYRLLCPAVYSLVSYDSAPIPLRVLQVAAHAKPLFDELIVWAAESADVKDPVLVGIRVKADQYKTRETYILARWAEALDEFPALIRQAKEKVRAKFVAKVASLKREVAEMEAMALGEVDLDYYNTYSYRF